MTDVAVVGQDPRFRGGALAQLESFWQATKDAGREPELFYLRHPTLRGVSVAGSPVDLPGTSTRFGHLDALHQLEGARLLAPRVRSARSLWVVATVASHGGAAPRSGRPYACWLATALEDEWASRRSGLPRSRRLALAANAPVLRRLERAVLRGATRVYGISEAMLPGLAAAGIERERLGVLPLPVDLTAFAPLPLDDWLAGVERQPTLVFVGRANDPRKNVGLLLDALPALRRRIPGARVRIVGVPPDGPLPEGAAATGPVASVAEHVRDAALLVLPSLQEGFGIVAAEALAAGVPVVATPSGGPERLVRASGGGVVLESFAAEELAGVAASLLEDADTLTRMRDSGRQYVEREHSPARLASLLADAFRATDTV